MSPSTSRRWRQSTDCRSAHCRCGVRMRGILRSASPGQKHREQTFRWATVKDLRLWSYTLVYSGSIISEILPPASHLRRRYLHQQRPHGRPSGGWCAEFAVSRRAAGWRPDHGFYQTAFSRRNSQELMAVWLLSPLFFSDPAGWDSIDCCAGAIAFSWHRHQHVSADHDRRSEAFFGSQRTLFSNGFPQHIRSAIRRYSAADQRLSGNRLNPAPGNTSRNEESGLWELSVVRAQRCSECFFEDGVSA